jgi:rhodanese-related sulfurtransferase
MGLIFIWTISGYFEMKQDKTESENKKIETENLKIENEKKAFNSLPFIKPAELKKVMFGEKMPVVIDLREESLYQKSHIINSILFKNLDNNRSDRNIVLITETGKEENLPEIYKSLTEKNNQVTILEGGIKAWENSGGIIISLGDPNSFVDRAKIRLIEPRDVNKIYTEQPESILIVDVRGKENFTKSHIPGAINLPITELEKKYREIPNKKNVYVYGTDELSSFSAGVILYDLGFFNTETINGGFNSWQKYNYPVEVEERKN